MSTFPYIWHYTIGDRAALILSDQLIKPATAGVPIGETPVVWFSARQHWEPTANKMIQTPPKGELRRLTFEQTIRLGGGGWRFGISWGLALPWRELIQAANIKTARELANRGRKWGADPGMWYGTLGPVQLDSTVAVQRLVDGEWVPWAG